MSDIQLVHHVGLTVSDLERSTAFYRDLLGCRPVMWQEKRGGYLAAIVGYPDAEVSMCHLKAPLGELVIELFEYRIPGSIAGPLEPRRIGNAHLCFLVPDLRSVHARLSEAGVAFISGPVEVDTGANLGGIGLYFLDPDGVTLELFQPPPGSGLLSPSRSESEEQPA
jgi:lactoylglutathione lyase